MGEAMPTHEHALSPLRHAIANPDLKSGPAEIIITFGPFAEDVVERTCHAIIDWPLTNLAADVENAAVAGATAVVQQKIEFRYYCRRYFCAIIFAWGISDKFCPFLDICFYPRLGKCQK